jgi:hypothetical protein
MSEEQGKYEFGASPDKVGAIVDAFFDQIEPRVPRIGKGRPWTFGRLNAACDDPGGAPVQAVIYPSDGEGFTLYARQEGRLHSITYQGRPVRFRTIEKALTTLSDVAYLDPEIVIDMSCWCEDRGPV